MKHKLSAKLANLILSFLAILLFVFAEPSLEGAKEGLRICGTAVIPSLFPFMILSGIIVRMELLSPIEPFFPMGRLFSLPKNTASPFLLGALCGFPIGAKTTCDLYYAGKLTKSEAEECIAVSNNTGPAFAVNVAGEILWGSRVFGWYLYGTQILSAVTVGILFRSRKRAKENLTQKNDPSHSSSPIRVFAESVSSAAGSVIPLCGYIVFFSVLSAIAKELFPSGIQSAILCGFLEFTSGIKEAACLGGSVGRFLTGFALGFSGLSVFVQSYSFTSQSGLSLRRTFLLKWIQGLLCGSLSLLYPIFFL